MAKIIAGIYEIQQQIGAGGGGIVYLGRHIRLDKQIVLKADRRTLNTDAEILRREVDMLKELSHTYIPQVYDFVQEDGVVYTVMDFIDGESLARMLKRGQTPGQPQVIRWACQLLEALDYLHSRPPYGILHGDIKPANIMVRPNGDVCLIDYNIALALGEDGAVRVGFSRGYASPEHYGIRYVGSANAKGKKGSRENKNFTTRTGGVGEATGTAKSWGEFNSVQKSQATGVPESHAGRTEVMGQAEENGQMSAFSGSMDIMKASGNSDGIEEQRYVGATEVMGAQENIGRGAAEMQKYANITDIIDMPENFSKDRVRNAGISDSSKATDIIGNSIAARSEEMAGIQGAVRYQKTGSSYSQPEVMLNVRSDIYSLGATLYHFLSGHPPAQDALDVVPLGPDICSPQVSKIIQKAMEPDQDLRYQSAKEMLDAFRYIHRNDIRTKLHRRRIIASAAILSVMFLSGGASTFTGMKRLEQTQEALALSEYSANHLAEGNVSGAIQMALEAMPKGDSIFDAPVTAQAQKALTDALGVYDLSDGFKALDTIDLPSAPFTIAISPGGSYLAAVCQHQLIIFDIESCQKLETLAVQNSGLSDVVFVDETHIIYAGEQGVTAYDLEEKRVLWIGEEATTLAVSGDGTVVAAVNRDESHAVIYYMKDGTKAAECFFEDQHMAVAANDIFTNPHNHIFSLNETGNLLAVSFSEGGLQIFDWKNPMKDMIIYDESDYVYFEGGFCGKYFAFAANKNGKSLFGLIDTEGGDYIGNMESGSPFFVKTNKQGIYLANDNVLVDFNPDTLEQTELAYTNEGHITGFSLKDGFVMVTTDDKKFSFYDSGANLLSSELCKEPCDFVIMSGKHAAVANRSEPSVRILERESHEDAQIAAYDSRYIHNEARVSQDGETAMLFGYQDFCIYNKEGTALIEVELPESESIYDQQFRKSEEGSWLEVIWYDGTVRCYSAADGSVISETKGEPPAKDLYEEFYTDQYRIASSLHSAPEVYDLQSNQKVGVLEEDSYLTYVTQVGEYIITEYVSPAGDERYGLLLDNRLQTLARLPRLCDISDKTLIFDYGSGNLRQCRLYSLQELIVLGEIYLQNEEKKGDTK